MTRRESVLTTAVDAVERITPGSTVGFGGLMNTCHPMPIVREIIRRGIGDLHVVGLASGLEVDMLIAAGLVSRVSTPTVSAETVQAIAPAFRRAAQDGAIVVWECDEGMIYAALQAAAQRVPFAPWPVGMGSSYVEVNDGMEILTSPYGGKPVVAIKAIHIDHGFVHAAASDIYGNVQVVGGGFGDRALARASKHVVCTVERIIPNHEVRRNPMATSLSGMDAVIHAPFGSHPFASPGCYVNDVPFMREYLRAADAWLREDDRTPLMAWFDEWVHGAGSHWDYLQKVGLERLWSLEEGLHYDSLGEPPLMDVPA
jgi:glutaconate CoA-transferase subunit A